MKILFNILQMSYFNLPLDLTKRFQLYRHKKIRQNKALEWICDLKILSLNPFHLLYYLSNLTKLQAVNSYLCYLKFHLCESELVIIIYLYYFNINWPEPQTNNQLPYFWLNFLFTFKDVVKFRIFKQSLTLILYHGVKVKGIWSLSLRLHYRPFYIAFSFKMATTGSSFGITIFKCSSTGDGNFRQLGRYLKQD